MSSKGGGGFNEIRFEDLKGSEQVFVHGEKDLDIRIKNDRKELIDRDRHLMVTRDKIEKVGRDDHSDIARDQIEKIGRDHHVEVAGKAATKITGSNSLSVTGDVIEVFQGNHSSQVTQNLYMKAMQIVIEASTGLTLKQGANFIPDGSSGNRDLGCADRADQQRRGGAFGLAGVAGFAAVPDRRAGGRQGGPGRGDGGSLRVGGDACKHVAAGGESGGCCCRGCRGGGGAPIGRFGRADATIRRRRGKPGEEELDRDRTGGMRRPAGGGRAL